MSKPRVQFMRELNNLRMRGVQCLVTHGDEFYVVSTIDNPPETLVFPADRKGNITDWLEAAGGSGMTRGEAMADLARRKQAID